MVPYRVYVVFGTCIWHFDLNFDEYCFFSEKSGSCSEKQPHRSPKRNFYQVFLFDPPQWDQGSLHCVSDLFELCIELGCIFFNKISYFVKSH